MEIIYLFDGTVEFNYVLIFSLLDLFTSSRQVLKTGTTMAGLICFSSEVLFFASFIMTVIRHTHMYSIHIVCLYVFLEDGPFYCCVMVLSLALKPAL